MRRKITRDKQRDTLLLVEFLKTIAKGIEHGALPVHKLVILEWFQPKQARRPSSTSKTHSWFLPLKVKEGLTQYTF